MQCPACQHANDEGAETCFGCGQPLATTTAITRGTVLADRYEIVSQLGRGGMGVVYAARDRVLDEDVAVKVLRPDVAQSAEMAKRFRSEIKLARKVTHKNVCRIHEYSEDRGLRYISMELIEGTDLRHVVRDRMIDREQAFDLAIQIADGLAAIHEAGIVHRDLKTPNVMLDPQGVVKLMDFGIAKRAAGDGTTAATATGVLVGTPEYMSPEQARGERIDVRSDVYALGVVVFEIFTGQVPFKADTPLGTIMKHIHEPPPLEVGAAERIPRILIPVLQKMLAKSAEERYVDGAQVARVLRAAQARFREGATADLSREDTLRAESGGTATAPRRGSGLEATRILGATAVPASTRPPVRRRPPSWRARAWLAMSLGALAVAGLAVALRLRTIAPQGSASVASSSAPPPSMARLEPSPAPVTTPVRTAPSTRPATRPSALAAAAPRPVVAGASSPIAGRPPETAAMREAVPATAPAIAQPAPARPTPGPAAAEPEQGFVQVTVVPGAELFIDGTSLGPVTSKKVRVPAGAHAIRLVNADYQPLQRKVTILPGETARLIVDLAEEGIRAKR